MTRLMTRAGYESLWEEVWTFRHEDDVVGDDWERAEIIASKIVRGGDPEEWIIQEVRHMLRWQEALDRENAQR